MNDTASSTDTALRSSVTELEDNKVKLTVSVDAEAIDEAVDAAFREIAKEVRIPGFRPGKAPRKVLEARIGKGYARDQALRDALPEHYARAVRDHAVDAIAPPEIDITDGHDEGPVTFDAVVEVRPTIQVPGYAGLRVEVPSPLVTEDEITEQIDRLRRQYVELEPVDRPAVDDDHVTIDIGGTLDGEEISGLTATDYDYKVGSGAVVEEIDEHLRGAKAGDILEFEAEHPDPDVESPLEFRLLVKEVKAEVLPDLDDEFVAQSSEFDTVAELSADIETNLGSAKREQTANAVRDRLSEALAELVTDEVPEPMVDSEMRQRLEDMAMRLQAQGIEFEQWLQITGQTPEDLTSALRETATAAVKVDLALRAVADAEAIEVDDDEYDAEVATIAEQIGQEPEAVAAQFAESDYERAMRAEMRKRKALDWLIEHAEIVDPDGNPVDVATLEAETEDDDAGDADGGAGAESGPAEPEQAEEEAP